MLWQQMQVHCLVIDWLKENTWYNGFCVELEEKIGLYYETQHFIEGFWCRLQSEESKISFYKSVVLTMSSKIFYIVQWEQFNNDLDKRE